MPQQIGTARCADEAVRKLVTHLIRKSSKKRPEIAAAMSLHAGQKISTSMLNDWTAETKKRARFPAAFVEPFCLALGNDELQRHVMGDKLRKALKVGEAILEAKNGL